MTRRILIIEDDEDTAKLLMARLKSDDFEVRTSPDAATGLQLVREFEPDLIVLDLIMPAGGGISFLRNLKLSSHTNTIPVVVLTGAKDSSYKTQALEMGASAYLTKPYDAGQVISEIKKLLKIGETRTILVADDEEDVRKMISGRLKASGYRVVEASNGQEALEYIEIHKPDLAVIDLIMPELDGWNVCNKIRMEKRYKKIPIIMLSAVLDSSGRSGPLDQCDFMMAKPFDSEELLLKINELLSKKDR